MDSEYFERVAGDWDKLRKEYFPDQVREVALDTAGVTSGYRALDVGAGTGFVTEGLVARGARVIAVDPSTHMLEVLRGKFSAEQVDCRIGSAEKLPLEDGDVQAAFSNMALHHAEEPAMAVREMARVVEPGGAVAITDLLHHNHEWFITEFHDRWLGFTLDELKKWFSAAGLVDLKVDRVGQKCTAGQGGGELVEVEIFLAFGRVPANA